MSQNSELKPIKVLIIDDSSFNRQTIKGILKKAPIVEVVGVAVDGHDGMRKILELKPDIVTLDLEMPGMDGFALLRWIMREKPLPVIVVSSHGDESTVFKALEFGAVDFIIKPTYRASKELAEIENDLIRKVLGITTLKIEKLKKAISSLDKREIINNSIVLKSDVVDVVAIGASTGGPTAIQSILTRLPSNFPAAIVISQHMPRGFTKQFANRIDRISSLDIKEAEGGDTVERGKVLICPGGCHIVFEKLKKNVFTVVKDSSPSDRYTPSINMMMSSVAEIYGAKTIGILLTGMGNDGKDGMLEIKKRGGFTIAESEDSSVVFGMPNEAISTGVVDMVLPLEEIPAVVLNRMKQGYNG